MRLPSRVISSASPRVIRRCHGIMTKAKPSQTPAAIAITFFKRPAQFDAYHVVVGIKTETGIAEFAAERCWVGIF